MENIVKRKKMYCYTYPLSRVVRSFKDCTSRVLHAFGGEIIQDILCLCKNRFTSNTQYTLNVKRGPAAFLQVRNRSYSIHRETPLYPKGDDQLSLFYPSYRTHAVSLNSQTSSSEQRRSGESDVSPESKK